MSEIKGRILSKKNLQGIPGMIVYAYLKSFNEDNKTTIGDPSTETGTDGTFTISTTLASDNIRKNDLYFEVRSALNGKLIKSTEYQLVNDLILNNLDVELDDISTDIINTEDNYRVRGIVRNFDGSDAFNAVNTFRVKAWHVNHLDDLTAANETVIDGKTPLSTDAVTINTDGTYAIGFQRLGDHDEPIFEKGKLNLLLEVIDNSNDIVIRSPLIINAKNNEEINLSIGDQEYIGRSDFETITDKIGDKLDNLNDLSTIKDKNFAVLSNIVDADPKKILNYIQSRHFASKLSLDTAIFTEVFYGLLSSGAPTSLRDILLADGHHLKSLISKAYDKNIVSNYTEANIDTILDKAPEQALVDEESNLYLNLGITTLTDTEKQTFITTYINNKDNINGDDDLWTLADSDSGLSSAKITELKCIFDLSFLTQQHQPLIEHLYDLKKTSYNGLTDFISYSKLDWIAEMNSITGFEPPTNFTGQDLAERNDKYADYLYGTIEKKYPSEVFIENIRGNGVVQPVKLDAFLHANPDFKFGEDHIGNYILSDSNGDFTEDELEELQALQRLFIMAPIAGKFQVVEKLWAKNFKAATTISKLGRTKFLNQLAGDIDEDILHKIYSKAFKTSLLSLMNYARYAKSFNEISTYAVNAFNVDPQRDDGPSLEKLFGSLDYCSCRHCRSVLSPPAYLVDLLLFLQNGEANNSALYQKLKAKRPDIEKIELSCQNTNTLVPYIDLVNEALENLVVNNTSGNSNQTALDSETILALPEHLNPAAYDILKDAIYPWKMPFNLWTDESRAYFDFLAIKRWQIMEIFPFFNAENQPENSNQYFNTDSPYWNNLFDLHAEIKIASEYLKLSKLDRDIITGIHAQNQEWKFYGLTDNWSTLIIDESVKISDLLKKSGLTFDELKELISSGYINPTSKSIAFANPNKCGLDTATIDFNSVELIKLHKFTRLKRKLNWTVKELDLAIDNLTTDDELNDAFIVDLWKVKKLADRYQIPVVELLAWWYDMDKDTDGRYEIKSLYTNLFLNKAVKNPVSDPMELQGLISDNDNIQIFKAALNITAEEIRLLIDGGFADDDITIVNITKLFRVASFCQHMDISVKDFIDLHTITNSSGVFSNTDATIAFIKHVDYLKNSPFNVEELGYLINNFARVNSTIKPATEEINIQLNELRTELLKKKSELLVQRDNSIDLLHQQVIIEPMIIDGAGSHIHLIVNTILSPENIESPTIPESDSLIYNQAYFKDSTLAIKKLLTPNDPGYLNSLPERYAFFMGQHSFIPAGELAGYTENELQEMTKQLLQKVVANNVVKIISGESTISVENQNSIINDQNVIFNQSNFNDIDPKDLFTNANSNNFISLRQARLDAAIKALNVEEDESQTVKNLRHLLRKTFEEPDINSIVEFVTKKDMLDNDEQLYLIESLLSTYLEDVQEAKDKLVYRTTGDIIIENENVILNVNLRASYLIGELLLYHLKNLIINFFSTRFGINAGLMEDMLLKYVPHPKDENKSGIRIFLNYSFLGENVAKADHTNQQQFYLKLYKAAMVARKYFVTREDAAIILQDDGEHWMNFCNLSVGDEESTGTYSRWLNLNKAYQIQQKYFTGDLSLFGYINSRPEDADNDQIREYWSILGNETGWLQEDIEYMICANKFEYPDNFKNEEWVYKLQEQFAIINKIGVAAKEIIKWNKTMETTAETARDIREAIKAHYNNKKWIDIATPLRNELRQKQRDALVSYLTGNNDEYEDAFDLYDAILLDPEMEPCAMTSRIKQATLSVQLFIQRVLLNLETVVDSETLLSLTDTQAEEWKWRKNYRLWEANRKVFLTPENWLDPELRMDKSPMFTAIEEKLTQSEVSAENVQQMYLDYLSNLDEVARLEIAGMFEEDNGNIHVIGRTPSNPHKYYYRKQVASSWTPWSPIDVEIEGDHLLPVFWHGQLFLYWPVFIEKAVEDETLPYPDPDKAEIAIEKPKKYFEIKLAWTRLKDGKWDSKRMSTNSYDMHEPEFPLPNMYHRKYDYNNNKKKIALFGYFNNFSEDTLNIYLSYPIDLTDNPFPDERDNRIFCKIIIESQNAEPLFTCNRGITYYPITGKSYSFLEYNNSYSYLNFYPDLYEELISIYNNKFSFSLSVEDTEFKLPIRETYFAASGYMQSYKFTFNQILELPFRTNIVFPHINPVDGNYMMIPWMYLENTGTGKLKPSHPLFIEILASSPNKAHTFFVNYKEAPSQVYYPNPGVNEIGSLIGNALQPASIHVSKQLLNQNILAPDTIAHFYSQQDASLIINRALVQYGETGYPTEQINMAPEGMEDGETDGGQGSQSGEGGDLITGGLKFHLFEHPYVKDFISYIQFNGLDTFLKKYKLEITLFSGDFFDNAYSPNHDMVSNEYPGFDIDLSASGPYSVYNRELFFHLPMMVANRLSQNQQFAEAMRWYHYIFDPTTTNSGNEPANFWKYPPFVEVYTESGNPPASIIDLFIDNPDNIDTMIKAWIDDPFNPHAAANFRPRSYMMYVIMKYLDNLVFWGDMLFNQDSLESLNEASQLYILAAKLLGRRPMLVEKEPPEALAFEGNNWNNFGNLLQIENYVLLMMKGGELPPALFASGANIVKIEQALSIMQSTITMHIPVGATDAESELYFCIPENEKLLSYWDVVSDRLFKLRNCMSIKGIVRQLPLFQPPIDPGLLIKAKAAGVDLTSALSDLNAPLPLYRFKYNLQKAIELTHDVKSLGGALLSALEKKDAEGLALMRAMQQKEMHEAMETNRKKSIEEAQTGIEALQLSRKIIEERIIYYSSREYMNAQERMSLDKTEQALKNQQIAMLLGAVATELSLYPTSTIGIEGFGGSPVVTFSWGLQNLISGINSAIGVISQQAGIYQSEAGKAATKGGYDRRMDEWRHQTRMAELELPQIDKQLTGAEIRLAMAERELETLALQISQSETELAFMEDKFTRGELYSWMLTQLSTLYFQSYQMAYDMAKRAEKALRFELGKDDSDFIRFGYWDSLKQGLLSGEKLHKDLRQMEMAYAEQNEREYEITKHLSLAMLDPQALIDLRVTGKCIFDVPEVLYDMDYAGQYFRRIKSVSVSIPAVCGSYTNISCRLTMQKNRYRKTTGGLSEYPFKGINDARFVHNLVGIQSIATSNAQNDSGMFQFNFNDERYLPFEGAGAIGTWALEMPDKYRQFDYDTIADVILHINYTAREGGDTVRAAAVESIDEMLAIIGQNDIGLARLFSMKAEFPNELHQFLNSTNGNNVDLVLQRKHFPYFLNNWDIKIVSNDDISVFIRPDNQTVITATTAQGSLIGSSINLNASGLSQDIVDDIWIVVKYKIEEPAS